MRLIVIGVAVLCAVLVVGFWLRPTIQLSGPASTPVRALSEPSLTISELHSKHLAAGVILVGTTVVCPPFTLEIDEQTEQLFLNEHLVGPTEWLEPSSQPPVDPEDPLSVIGAEASAYWAACLASTEEDLEQRHVDLAEALQQVPGVNDVQVFDRKLVLDINDFGDFFVPLMSAGRRGALLASHAAQDAKTPAELAAERSAYRLASLQTVRAEIQQVVDFGGLAVIPNTQLGAQCTLPYEAASEILEPLQQVLGDEETATHVRVSMLEGLGLCGVASESLVAAFPTTE